MSDGPLIWELVGRSPGLDRNSPYCYLLLCSHFADTCLVAYSDDGALHGFVSGYLLPGRPDTIFVWQVAVAPEARRTGLGRRLIETLLERAPAGVNFLEATVTPSNTASLQLFRAIARDRGVGLTQDPFFGSELFPSGGNDPPDHEPELLLRVGPVGRMHVLNQDSDRQRREAQCK